MTSGIDLDNRLEVQLQARAAAGLLRSLPDSGSRIDFASNDYLGFARSPAPPLPDMAGLPSGATGSRLVSGNSSAVLAAENMIAAFHRREAALIFSSGYMASLGLFSCIAGRGDTFISDEHMHAGAIDGMRLSQANRFKFRHNDLQSLEQKLRRARGTRLVVVESVYSMDGSQAPLAAILDCCRSHNALLIVDEAHALGVTGSRGEGLVSHLQLEKEVYAVIHTFGKALGLQGAAVTGSRTLRQWLINHARSFIYSTALPPATCLQIAAAYRCLPDADRGKLEGLIAFFRTAAKDLLTGSLLPGDAPVQALLTGDTRRTRAMAAHLHSNGFFVKAMLAPAVPAGTERLRICLHTYNTIDEVRLLITEINNFHRLTATKPSPL